MQVVTYPKNKDAYQQGNIGSWAKKNKLDYVVEIHRNSSTSSAAKGAEIWIKQGYPADKKDKATLNALLALGYSNRGIKKTNNLANVNRMAISGISYCLTENGFIKNANDNKMFDNSPSKQGQLFYDYLLKSGVKRLGVVYGHGQGDPGAVSGKRKEADDVRKIIVKSKGVETPSNQGGIKVLKANQLLASHGRIVLPANRALYDSIPTKKTPFTKVIQKGQYFYNGFYTIEKYKGVDSQGRKCNFVQIRDLNNNKLLGYAPVYSSDEIYRTKLELIKLP